MDYMLHFMELKTSLYILSQELKMHQNWMHNNFSVGQLSNTNNKKKSVSWNLKSFF